MRLVNAFAEQLTGFAAAVAAPQRSAEVDQCAGMLESCRGVGQGVYGVAEQLLTCRAALDQPKRAERHPDGAGRAPTP